MKIKKGSRLSRGGLQLDVKGVVFNLWSLASWKLEFSQMICMDPFLVYRKEQTWRGIQPGNISRRSIKESTFSDSYRLGVSIWFVVIWYLTLITNYIQWETKADKKWWRLRMIRLQGAALVVAAICPAVHISLKYNKVCLLTEQFWDTAHCLSFLPILKATLQVLA